MMKKILFPIIFIITFLLANTTKVNAKPIDSRVAALVARNFMVNNTGKNYTIKDIVPEFYYDNSIVAFYVSFNEGGWVIVSANDLTVPILAYNEYGESNVNEKPDNSLDLLEGYYDCIKTVESYSIDNVYAKEEWERLLVLESKLSNKDNDKIQSLNEKLKTIKNVSYVDVYCHLVDETNNLKIEYTMEGLHINTVGYKIITQVLLKEIEKIL